MLSKINGKGALIIDFLKPVGIKMIKSGPFKNDPTRIFQFNKTNIFSSFY